MKRKIISSGRLFFGGLLLAFFLAVPKFSFAASANLIANPSLENANGNFPANWTQGQWGNLSANFEYPVPGHTGNGAKVTVDSYTDGDAKWYFDDVPVKAGSDYAFSDWSNSSVDTRVVVRFHLIDGSDRYSEIGTVAGTGVWTHFNSSFVVPTGTSSITVFHVISGNGTLTVDDYLLEEIVSNSNSTTNIVANPSLENANGNFPANWTQGQWGNLSANFEYPVPGHTGNGAKVTVDSYADGDAKWYFEDVPVKAGSDYAFSDWSNSSVDTDVMARLHMADGSDQYLKLGTVYGTGDWTKFTSLFSVPIGTVSVTVFHLLNANGSLTVDDYSLEEIGASPKFTEGMVSFSFDDGFENTYTNGIPILDKAGIKSTQAIITSGFNDPEYMTKDQVKILAANGHEISAHTRTHPDLVTLTQAQAMDEISGSKADLAALGITATSFMYPFDSYSDSVVSLVKNAGFLGARDSDIGYNTPLSNPYLIESQNVNNDVSIDTIKGWIDKAISEKLWVVLVFHRQVKLPNTPENLYCNDPAILQQIVDYVKLKNVKTVTVGQGVSMLGK